MGPSFLWRPDIFLRACWRKLRKRPERCLARTAWGATLEVEPRRFIGGKIYMRGVHELAVCEALWRLTRPEDRAVDVGANIGVMTSVLSRRAGEVTAFEPHPELFGQLEGNVRRWKRNVNVMQRAVSNESGYVKICEGEWFGVNEGTAGIEDDDEKEDEEDAVGIEIRAVRLDDAVAGCEVMKVDVEGHEFEVLEGAAGLLKAGGVRDIVFESGFPSGTHELLAGYGYDVFELHESLWGPVLVEAKTQRVRGDYWATLDGQRARRIMGKRGWKVLWGRADCKLKIETDGKWRGPGQD
jgi:FkbM family methyltransferase